MTAQLFVALETAEVMQMPVMLLGTCVFACEYQLVATVTTREHRVRKVTTAKILSVAIEIEHVDEQLVTVAASETVWMPHARRNRLMLGDDARLTTADVLRTCAAFRISTCGRTVRRVHAHLGDVTLADHLFLDRVNIAEHLSAFFIGQLGFHVMFIAIVQR